MKSNRVVMHKTIPWYDLAVDGSVPVKEARLEEKSALVGRVGKILLESGTGAWRVREAMNAIAENLGLICMADVGLVSIEYSCIENENSFTQVISLTSTGVNTDRLSEAEHFVRTFKDTSNGLTLEDAHRLLDDIEKKPENYKVLTAALASGLACGAFVFLLGGGPIEMICAFFGAGVGNYIRKIMAGRHLTLLACIAVSVMAACFTYIGIFNLLQYSLHITSDHEAGYIGAMLFVIPGFPLITSGIDVAKQDMRSGIERLVYALMIITAATLVGWVAAVLCRLAPSDFALIKMQTGHLILLRLIMSFCGVFGFSVMFNSSLKMASSAGLIGAFANTLRLTLISFFGIHTAVAAFIGAAVAGLIASAVNRRLGFPRITLTVPSVVIMVPGLYMYRAVYNLGTGDFSVGGQWLISAILITLAIPLGLIAARFFTDPKWRHCG